MKLNWETGKKPAGKSSEQAKILNSAIRELIKIKKRYIMQGRSPQLIRKAQDHIDRLMNMRRDY